jgi:hypothetical protein
VPYPPEGICADDCPAVSDRAMKEGFAAVDESAVLEQLVALPVTEWSYVSEGGDVRHMGPMAQDFHEAFGLGDSDRHIHPVDSSGVVIAAIQALHEQVEHVEQENLSLRRSNDSLRKRLTRLESRER